MHFSQSATSVNNIKPQSLDLNLLDIAFFSRMDKFIWSTWCLSITWQVRCSIRHCSIAITGHHVDIWSIDVQQWNACIPVSIRHIQLSTGLYTTCTMVKLLPLTFRNVKTLYLRFIYPSVPVGKVSGLLFHRCILKLILLLSEEKEMVLNDR